MTIEAGKTYFSWLVSKEVIGMSNGYITTGWHTTSDSASGVAHYWEKQKYSRRRSLCGRVTEAKEMQESSQTVSDCVRCKKALAAQATARKVIAP